MDVSKAKNVVVVLLVAFNIFLLVNNFIFHNSQSVSRETLENTRIILAQRGVVLECEIPSEPGGNNRFVYIKSELDREAVAGKLLGENYEVTGDGSQFYDSNGKIVFSDMDRFVYTAVTTALTQGPVGMKEAEEAALRFMKEKCCWTANMCWTRRQKTMTEAGLWII